MTYHYKPKGVCSKEMQLDIQDGILKEVKIVGGCDGNRQGVCALVKGLPAKDVMEKLRGIDCRGRGTSCPDQLAKAIAEYLETSE
ncbi:MAG: TIGR03905 family TSCPD domain-containing protein [Clostridia bacterium]|nr:TIGR03905 family TSCPD domain-containing protein [Clostridia bacterium]